MAKKTGTCSLEPNKRLRRTRPNDNGPNGPSMQDSNPRPVEPSDTNGDTGRKGKSLQSVVYPIRGGHDWCIYVTSGCVALCVAAAIGGTTVAIGALGFGAAGVAAGSAAAWYQSVFLGGAIAKGSIFATLQSVGAAGVAKTTYAALVATCTAACTAGTKIIR